MLGSPIGHSLSPTLHRAAYDALGLDWEYDAYEVTGASLGGFVAGLDRRWRGLSLTMPLKRAAIPLCDDVEPLAGRVEAVNTLLIEPDGRRSGHNTDVAGICAALTELGVARTGSALVVGTGATARSAVAALAQSGFRRVLVSGRSAERAAGVAALADGWGLDAVVVGWPLGGSAEAGRQPLDVAVSTVPVAAQQSVAESVVGIVEAVCDVGYDPPLTPLLRAAASAGRPAVGGLSVLVHQAARQVELMTGVTVAPVEQMRAAAVAALADRQRA